MPLTAILVFWGALAIALAATPMARRLAWRTGQTDLPSARKDHARPTPLLGGLAIYAAVMLALALFAERAALAQLAGILAGGTLIGLLGIWDDRHPMRPSLKLLGQTACALVLVASGVQAQLAERWLSDPAAIAVLNTLITVVWVLGIVNAANFMDNMDGVLGGVAAVASGAFLLLATANAQVLVAPLAAALLGASLGFLVYNFNPASIFMGDGGSLLLGFTLAAIGLKLRFPGTPTSVTWMIPPLVLALPLFDLALVMISRSRRGVNPFTTGGQDHLSHRLVRRGASRREAALLIWLAAAAAAGVALFVSHAGLPAARIALLSVLGLAALGIWKLELGPQPAESGGGPERN